ncbi:MAG: hypothetical protein KJN90_03420 [Gammaproteobacteria bacterium]|nr:hypothetical protein [Gammaproteobacteria bacterium]
MEETHTTDSRSTATPATSVALNERAEQNLQFIRELMESSSSFTGVSGTGYMLAGASALLATWIAMQQATASSWLLVWMAELLVAGTLAIGFTIRKTHQQGESLWSTTGKKVLFAFLPPMSVGAVLTVFMYRLNAVETLPGIWLCIYGTAVMTAGAYSVSVLPLMGGLFLGLGTVLLLLNPIGPEMLGVGNFWLGAGMGGLHLIFGYTIWKNYGG